MDSRVKRILLFWFGNVLGGAAIIGNAQIEL